jgi:glutamine synthetase
MQNLRDAVDAMESVTDHGYWPVPTYNDILFYA